MPEASLPLMVGRVLRAQRACPGSGDLGTLTSCCSVGSSFGDCSVQSEEDEGGVWKLQAFYPGICENIAQGWSKEKAC